MDEKTAVRGKSMKTYEALKAVYRAVELNHSKLREEPDSDGVTHDKWEAENDALNDLEEALEEAIDQYENAMSVRKSLRTIAINN